MIDGQCCWAKNTGDLARQRSKNLVKPILTFKCFAPEATVATAVAWRAWTYRAGNSRMKIWS
jgi:hypothetical protein